MVAHVNELNHKIDGFICDVCNKVVVNQFEYYSAKFDLIEVDCVMQKAGPKHIEKRYLDLDFCKECYEQLAAKVVANIEKRETESKAAAGFTARA